MYVKEIRPTGHTCIHTHTYVHAVCAYVCTLYSRFDPDSSRMSCERHCPPGIAREIWSWFRDIRPRYWESMKNMCAVICEKLTIKADNDNEKKRGNLLREEWNGSFCALLLQIIVNFLEKGFCSETSGVHIQKLLARWKNKLRNFYSGFARKALLYLKNYS